MERRTVIKQMALLCASAMLLPSCLKNKKSTNIDLKQLNVSAEQEELLAELVESIIPKTDSPGAKELGVHLFVLKMLDDCYTKENQERFLAGFEVFEGENFVDRSRAQRIKLLNEIMESKSTENNLQYFLKEVRKQTIKGYQQSEYVMTELKPYILVPGKFRGSVKRA